MQDLLRKKILMLLGLKLSACDLTIRLEGLMKIIQCESCGSKDLTEIDGYSVCDYCQSKFVPKADETISKRTTLGGLSDVELLLQKCETDPANRRRYASLILDMDPANPIANQYLY